MTESVCYDLKDIDLSDETNNLLINMSGGLLPENLTKREVQLLRIRFGKNWFQELGYRKEDGYINPEELRSIADKMEQVWKKSKVGDNNLVHTVCSGDENIRYAIKIRYDQERMLPKE